MSCTYERPKEYYDLAELKLQNHLLDRLVDQVVLRNRFRLEKMEKRRNQPIRDFYNVTPELVREFKPEAIGHLQTIQADLPRYGFLYNVIHQKHNLSHAVYIKYDEFALMESTALLEVEKIADQFAKKCTDYYDATCLYLLIFYALLVNPHANWVTIDYLTGCNRDHQYAIHINWSEQCKV